MLYALVLVVTTTTAVQPVATSRGTYVNGTFVVGAPYVTTEMSQQVIGYYRTERGCLAASIKRAPNWPDFAPGQSVTGLCVQVEIPANGVTGVGIDIVG